MTAREHGKCVKTDDGSVTPCWLLEECTNGIYKRGGGIQKVSLLSNVGERDKETIRHTFAVKSGQHTKGVVLNFCPFCGADLQRPRP